MAFIQGVGNIAIPGEAVASANPATNTQNAVNYESQQFGMNRQYLSDTLAKLNLPATEQQGVLSQWDAAPNHDAAMQLGTPYMQKYAASQGYEIDPTSWAQQTQGFNKTLEGTPFLPGALEFAALAAGMGGAAGAFGGGGLGATSIGEALPTAGNAALAEAGSLSPSLFDAAAIGEGASGVGALGAAASGSGLDPAFLDAMQTGAGAQFSPSIGIGAIDPGLTGAAEAGAAGSAGAPVFDAHPNVVNPAATAGSVGSNLTDALRNMTGIGAPFGNPMSLLSSGLNAANSLFGAHTAQSLARTASQAATQADPLAPYRSQFASELTDLSTNPDDIKKRPGYQSGLDYGTQALQRRLAQQGYLGSGNADYALQDFGTNYANDFLQSEQNNLATLAGEGIGSGAGGLSLTGAEDAANLALQSFKPLAYSAGSLYG